jgi:hypothetical protein
MDLREKISTTDESVNGFISEMASMIDSAENSSAMQLADACLDDTADEELNAQDPRVGQHIETLSNFSRPANTNYD